MPEFYNKFYSCHWILFAMDYKVQHKLLKVDKIELVGIVCNEHAILNNSWYEKRLHIGSICN